MIMFDGNSGTSILHHKYDTSSYIQINIHVTRLIHKFMHKINLCKYLIF